MSSRSPTMAGEAIAISSRLLIPITSYSRPARITYVSPCSLRAKILPL